MRLRVAIFVVLASLTVAVFSCRRNQPSLVDANRAPETELWYTPPDSSEYDYLVHLYWRGVDADGIVVRYIWTITDTLIDPALDWDPSTRIRDFRRGHVTSRTDSVFSFTAFRNVAGVGLKKNRQAFHISAIDDNGVIDPTPARIEFVATVQQLPILRFLSLLQGQPPKLYNPNAIDTVGMYRPFSVSYRGKTTNGVITGYRFFPLTSGVFLEGANEWTEDLSDTLRVFPNVGPDALPSGELRLAAQCRDQAGAESEVDAARFTKGVYRMVVNFEPDTEIFQIINTYFKNNTAFIDTVDFSDPANPDTIPYNSWIKLSYRGWDNPADSSVCQEPDNKCIAFQLQYKRRAEADGGPANGGATIESTVRWLPDQPEDSDPFGTTDTTSMSIGTESYEIRVRSVDEYGKPDGTPAVASVIGNHSPSLDSFSLENYDGTVIADGDTMYWDWMRPANFTGLPIDTLDFSNPTDPFVVREFYFKMKATGHDHPTETTGVRSWRYIFRDVNTGALQKFARSGVWTDGVQIDRFEDTFRAQFRYSLLRDPGGHQALAQLPNYFNRLFNYTMVGRDTKSTDEFEQFIWLLGEKVRQNQYNSSILGRWTEQGNSQFVLKMVDY